MSADDPLQAFFQADAEMAEQAVPARDPAFNTLVMERVAAQRFRLEFAARLLIGLALALAVWLALPGLLAALQSASTDLSLAAASLLITGFVAVAGQRWVRGGLVLPRLRLF